MAKCNHPLPRTLTQVDKIEWASRTRLHIAYKVSFCGDCGTLLFEGGLVGGKVEAIAEDSDMGEPMAKKRLSEGTQLHRRDTEYMADYIDLADYLQKFGYSAEKAKRCAESDSFKVVYDGHNLCIIEIKDDAFMMSTEYFDEIFEVIVHSTHA